MAEVRPLRALHYSLGSVSSLGDVVAPPYDVIDAAMREELLERSPFNVVEIDLPVSPGGGDPYEHAAETLEAGRSRASSPPTARKRSGRSSRSTRGRTARGTLGADSSAASESPTTAPASSARTSGLSPGPRRTACA